MEKNETAFRVPQINPGLAFAHGCCNALRAAKAGGRPRGMDGASTPGAGEGVAQKPDQKCAIDEGALARIRQLQGMLQHEMASNLGVTQAQIAHVERKQDMLLSTLRRYVAGLGGELDVVARFPGVSFHIGRGSE